MKGKRMGSSGIRGDRGKVESDKAKARLELANKLKLLKRDIAIATASPEGLNLMKWVFGLSGYSKTTIIGNPQTLDINLAGTLYNATRRAIWLEIRKMIPTRTLKKIEFEKLNLDVEDL